MCRACFILCSLLWVCLPASALKIGVPLLVEAKQQQYQQQLQQANLFELNEFSALQPQDIDLLALLFLQKMAASNKELADLQLITVSEKQSARKLSTAQLDVSLWLTPTPSEIQQSGIHYFPLLDNQSWPLHIFGLQAESMPAEPTYLVIKNDAFILPWLQQTGLKYQVVDSWQQVLVLLQNRNFVLPLLKSKKQQNTASLLGETLQLLDQQSVAVSWYLPISLQSSQGKTLVARLQQQLQEPLQGQQQWQNWLDQILQDSSALQQ